MSIGGSFPLIGHLSVLMLMMSAPSGLICLLSAAEPLRRRWHPDRNTGEKKDMAEKKFKEVCLPEASDCVKFISVCIMEKC